MPSFVDYRDFIFPLNVYAHILMLEEGAVNYLHYGLYSKPETTVSAGQHHASQLVLEHLPSLPCRILEVGFGLASTLVELKQLGYDVAGITPDPAQEKHAKEHFGADLSVVCTKLEDFSAPAESLDVILFQQSAQHISPLDIFSKAAELLVADGEMLILDEFALDRTKPGKENLHLLKDFIALAGRFGFEVAEQLDLSLMAAPTLDYLLAGVKKHRSRLAQDLDLSPSLLDGLNLSIQADREKYAAGRCGYILLRLKKITMPRWRLGEITEANHEQMLALFKTCFGHEMSPAHWHWKYAEGRGQAIGVWQDQELIAHYGGTTRDILFFGQPQKGLYPCDVMVKQEGRGSLSRKGPFFLVTATFLESYQGYGNKHVVALGFPSERHNAVAKRLGFYYNDEVDHMVEISWTPKPCRPQVWSELKILGRDDGYSKKVADQIWQKMSRDFAAELIGVRDWNYLKHRYFDHPDKHYEVCLVRNRISRRPYGVIVYHRHERDCELLDVIAPLAEIQTLIDQARKIAGCLDTDRLYCWTAAHYSHLFESTGGEARDLGISIPTISWTAGPPLEQISQRCWLMGGDTDSR
ncbi:MAG: hypothetical protein ACD_23C00695G0002 [uncultured bacterium]|nr:MAG: hypothetical protein ACD_23C00695G0002 [uncultured bacterium]